MCRQMMVSGNSKDLKVNEFHLETILSELGLTQEQFIDMCILCGCDYMDTIPGIGPKRALELVRKWGSMEEILENLDESKFKVPENFPYKEARALFLAPDVQKEGLKELLQWGPPDEEGLVEFLVKEKDFREERQASE